MQWVKPGKTDKKPPRNFFRGGTVCYRVGRGFRQELLAELLELVSDELNLGSDDDLDGGLTGTDDAGSAGGLDDLLVNQQTVLDFQSQTGDAVVDGGDIGLAANAFQDDLSHLGEVVVSQLDVQLVLSVVLTAGGLQIPLGDGETEDDVEDHEGSQAQRSDQPGLGSCGQGSGEDQVGATSGKVIWVAEGFPGYMESRPAVDSANIYCGGWEGRFWGIERSSGRKKWEHNIGKGRYFSPGACWPIISGGNIFIQSSDNVLRCFSPDGSVLWENTSAKGRESTGISEDGNTLYVKGTTNTFTAFDLTRTGYPVKWETVMPYEYNYIPTAPLHIASRNLVLAADTFGTICAVDDSGKGLQWQYKFSNCAVTSFCRTPDGGAIAMSMDGKIVKLNF